MSKALKNASSLPKIPKSRGVSRGTSSRNQSYTQTYPPSPEVDRGHGSVYQRLSGFDAEVAMCSYTTGGANKIHSSLCVRCSEHACLCMQCNETLIENSLTFYKETRARGAMALFDNAITQAGASKCLKFTIFRIWKNGFTSRMRLKNKRAFIAERRHRKTVTIKPFLAWKRYISLKYDERQHKKIEGTESSVATLNAEVTLLTKEKMAADEKKDYLTRKLDMRDALLTNQHQILMKIYGEIAKDRERMIGFCSLIESFISLTNIVEEASSSTSLSVNNMLDDLSVRPMHDYMKVFDSEIRDMAKFHRRKVITVEHSLNHTSNSETNEEARIANKSLFEFVNTFSRDVGIRIEPTSGRSLAKYLPPYERASGFSDLKNGRQLCRVIMALVHDKCDYLEQLGETAQRLTQDQWDDLQSSQYKPMHIVRLMLKHSAFYLHVPLYRFEDVLEGNVEVIQSLIGHLILCSAPIMHTDYVKALEKSRQQCKAIQQGLHQLLSDGETQSSLSRLFGVWKSLNMDMLSLGKRGPESTSSSTTGGMMTEKLSRVDASLKGGMGHWKPEDDKGDDPDKEEEVDEFQRLRDMYEEKGSSDFFNRLGDALDRTDGLPLDTEISERYPIFRLHSSYDQLSASIDDFLSQGVHRRISFNVAQLGQNINGLGQLRHDVDHMMKESEEGIVLAADIRQHVVSHNFVMLLRRLRYISDDNL
mmetsp:Transcript_5446/g.5601  ORF Transcript_5446/g.5601 Transcript_5446/m.5601 type:complete len:705 (-) Transcript_5446:124-2238(-)